MRLRRAARSPSGAKSAAQTEQLPGLFDRERRDMENLRRLIAFTLRHDSCCVDVGAHRGAVLQEIVRVAPAGRHLAFEPLAHLAAQLRTRFPSVEVHQAALSSHTGASSFEHVRGDAEGCSGFLVCTLPPGYEADVERIEVRLERLDDVLADRPAPALLKVDVEGAEQQVLQGAERTLARARPTVVFEHAYSASSAFGTSPLDVHGLLSEAGLRIFDLDGSGPIEPALFDELSRRGDPVNFVAHP
jgi:FkbM family methyltransferase